MNGDTRPRREAGQPARERADPRSDEHASILRSLGLVDWLVLLVVALYMLVDRTRPPSPTLLMTAVGLFAAFVIAMRWRGFPVQDPAPRIAMGAAAMVAFISVVAQQTGGPESPLVNLYLLPVVLVAMTLGRRATLVVFVGVALAYVSVTIGDEVPEPARLFARLFGELGPFALVAYLTQSLTGSIDTARRRIEEMAERDGLTGLLNHRTFRDVLEREHLIRWRATRGGYGLLMIDVDQLKKVNDDHGHQAGNAALTTVSAAIQRAIRGTDVAARYGGDEFVLFLSDATPEVAEAVAQRVRNNVYKSLFPVGGRLQRMTVSVGAASYPRDGQTPDEVLEAADRAMYRDKELRRRSSAEAKAREAAAAAKGESRP